VFPHTWPAPGTPRAVCAGGAATPVAGAVAAPVAGAVVEGAAVSHDLTSPCPRQAPDRTVPEKGEPSLHVASNLPPMQRSPNIAGALLRRDASRSTMWPGRLGIQPTAQQMRSICSTPFAPKPCAPSGTSRRQRSYSGKLIRFSSSGVGQRPASRSIPACRHPWPSVPYPPIHPRHRPAQSTAGFAAWLWRR
jgi:hypothetical protein